jgi:hypothetical protein
MPGGGGVLTLFVKDFYELVSYKYLENFRKEPLGHFSLNFDQTSNIISRCLLFQYI